MRAICVTIDLGKQQTLRALEGDEGGGYAFCSVAVDRYIEVM